MTEKNRRQVSERVRRAVELRHENGNSEQDSNGTSNGTRKYTNGYTRTSNGLRLKKQINGGQRDIDYTVRLSEYMASRKKDPDSETYFGPPPMTQNGRRHASAWQILMRLGVWIGALWYFFRGDFVDSLLRRSSEERRAVRLREALELAGGTMIKIGQQMSIRLDILPYRYCFELSRMLDAVPPFPFEETVKILEKAYGKPCSEVFSELDDKPIGSASIAVVYRGVLRDCGERVAIKVRRPNIEVMFDADLKILKWLLQLAETLTLVKPGLTTNVREELQDMFLQELDFRREARYQEIFSIEAEKSRKSFFRAPELYDEYCRHNIIVQEYVEGIWLGDLLAAVESKDTPMLRELRAVDIDPDIVASRILWVNYWGMFENLFFHADPHPGNILIQPGNYLIFIDFGAAGTINTPYKMLYQKLFDAQNDDDAWQMAQAALALLEPLNGIDINLLVKELEAAFYENLLAFKSRQSHWYERTTANVWISFLQLVRKHQIAPPRDILLFARSRFLYDTLSARLSPEIDFWDEFQEYYKGVNKKNRKDLRKSFRKRIEKGLLDKDYTMIDTALGVGGLFIYRLRRLLLAPYDFVMLPYLVDKVSYMLLALLELIAMSGALYLIGVSVVGMNGFLRGVLVSREALLITPLLHPVFWIAVGVVTVIILRRIAFRLQYRVRHQY